MRWDNFFGSYIYCLIRCFQMLLLHPKELHQIEAHLTKTLKPHVLNSLLRTLTLSQTPSKVLPIYNKILHISDHFTYTYALKACSLLPATHTSKGLEIHAHILKSGHLSDLFIQNSLISFYSSAADVISARRVLSGISTPDVVSWTSIISALARNGQEREALLAFTLMEVRPNPMTLVSVLPACSKLKALKLGKSVHGYCVRSFGGHGNNIILDNAILDMYMNCKDLNCARYLFEEMPVRDVVSWTTIISGYARAESFEKAIKAFVEMLRDGKLMPNEATLVSVLRACASMGALRLGKWMHSYLFRSCIGVDTLLSNALINMYAKCGDMGMALKVFKKLQCKDLISWCTIIGGMAVNGRARSALQLFASMLPHGVQPDSVVFIAVLSACCHAGLVDDGWRFFKAMREVYGIDPQKEHYACLIDTFCRAGRLEEAEELALSMPIEPDGHIWGALLNACKIHGADEAVSERLGRQVLGGEVVVGGGTYALISNMLAKDGKWEESTSIREQMRVRRIRKTVGRSWIELHRLQLAD